MEPVSAVALSLALGAAAVAGKEVAGSVARDAYAALKSLIRKRYPKVSIDQLEQAPELRSRRAVVEEDLIAAGAGQDTEVLAAAHRLAELIRQEGPGAAAAIGVDLKEIEAANLRLADIAASGTGVRLEKGKFTGDIDIRSVRAGHSPERRDEG